MFQVSNCDKFHYCSQRHQGKRLCIGLEKFLIMVNMNFRIRAEKKENSHLHKSCMYDDKVRRFHRGKVRSFLDSSKGSYLLL